MSFQDLGVCLAIQGLSMLVPGPNHLLLLSINSSDAYARTMAVFGIASAGIVFSSGVIFSFWLGGEIASAKLFIVLNLLGSGYLTFLGTRLCLSFWRNYSDRCIDAWKARAESGYATSGLAVTQPPFFVGFFVNISNPKSALFFASIFATTIPISDASQVYLVVAVLAFFLNSLIFHGFVAGFFSLPRIQSFISSWFFYIRLLAGLVFIAVGLTFGLGALHGYIGC